MEKSPQVYVKPMQALHRRSERFEENDVPCHHLPADT